MKKLILTENKFNVLLEYAGFVNGWQKLIDYIYQYSYEKTYKYIKSIVKNTQGKTSEEIFSEFSLNDNVSWEKTFNDWVISENYLNMLNVYGIKNITIKYMIDDDFSGSFDSDSMSIGKDGKLNNFTIIINVKNLYFNTTDYKQTLQHELSHAYEMMKRIKQNGYDSSKMNYKNKHYNSGSGIVNGISYYFSKREMNAVISETAYLLQQNNPNNEQECWNLINNSYAITNFYNTLEQIKNGLERNINYTYSVIEFLKINNEHIDMFPNPRNNNVQSYQRRLIRSAEFKIQYFKNKLNKVVKTYLKRKGVVN